jgi:hypothetical protein
MVSLESAVEIVKHCSRGFRVSELIRMVHRIASEERKTKIAAVTNTGAGECCVKRATERDSEQNPQ